MADDTSTHACIEISSLCKSYSIDGTREVILSDINLTVHQGEFVSIIGPSGCGKSTLLNIIAGLDEADTGHINVKDVEGDRLGNIGYMQQKDLLLPWRSVLDNAAIGLEVQGFSTKDARAKVKQGIERFGLSGFEDVYPYALSGGMKQRVSFLRTMIMDQSIVLLDEPFGALDSLTRVQMQSWLLEVWELMKKTIVLVTHDVDEAIFLSDRICLLSARPGANSDLLTVELARPRDHSVLTSSEFGQIKQFLLSKLWAHIERH
jgi:ABC-type nitrate/sulfonate/bicarbonate transport system ATPase subunit